MALHGAATRTAERLPRPLGRWIAGVLGLLFILALAAAAGGKAVARLIEPADRTTSTEQREIVIANNVFLVPDNVIHPPQARRDRARERLDLQLRWPDMQGYSAETRDDFDRPDGGTIVHITIRPQQAIPDMSGRFGSVYAPLLIGNNVAGPDGLSLHRFTSDGVYAGDILALGVRSEAAPFVARCLAGPAARHALATCERDIHFADGLALAYRFHESLLVHWRNLDRAMLAAAGSYLRLDG